MDTFISPFSPPLPIRDRIDPMYENTYVYISNLYIHHLCVCVFCRAQAFLQSANKSIPSNRNGASSSINQKIADDGQANDYHKMEEEVDDWLIDLNPSTAYRPIRKQSGSTGGKKNKNKKKPNKKK